MTLQHFGYIGGSDMYIYKNGSNFSVFDDPFDEQYGVKNNKGELYSKSQLETMGFFVDTLPIPPSQGNYTLKADFENCKLYYHIDKSKPEEGRYSYLISELANSKLETMKLKSLLKLNSEEIAKTKIEIMQLKGGVK
ncbi:TPA: hypothetical protein ACXDAM_002223 [Clostridium botulinum]|nr:hypothetical protein [Clostridium botulinum]